MASTPPSLIPCKEQIELTEDVADSGILADPAAEKRIRRAFDIWLLPVLTLTCIFCFTDRSNIGSANITGMPLEIGMTGFDFNWASTAFVNLIMPKFVSDSC
jgi:hypothetical protein